MPDPQPQDGHADLIDRLETLRSAALDCERDEAAALEAIPQAYRPSAANLLHYVAVRRFDLRDLQQQLHELGLSSLGRMEPYVLPTLDAVSLALHRLTGKEPPPRATSTAAAGGFTSGPEALRRHADELLGTRSGARQTRLMVTAAEYWLAAFDSADVKLSNRVKIRVVSFLAMPFIPAIVLSNIAAFPVDLLFHAAVAKPVQ